MKRLTVFSLSIIFIFLASGCATGVKKQDLEISGLRNQVMVLENQLREKDDEIANLEESLNEALQEKKVLALSLKQSSKKRVIGEVKSRPNIKQIQIALRNAGYSPGAVDGKMGRQTKSAIRAFQKENNLKVDGRVGKRTWGLLKKYLYKKEK